MSTSYRDAQRYRKTYSYMRPVPRPETIAAATIVSDQALKELDWKNSVRAASTSDISIGSTIVVLDGVTLNDGNRVLIKDQASPSENGIYVWSSSTQLLSRAEDAVQGTLTCGAACYVEEGSQSGSAWLLATFDPITVGSTSLTWVLFGGSSIFLTNGQEARTIYSASFGGSLYPSEIGQDIFFFVSGSSTEKAVFGGDTVVSGVLSGSEGIFLSDILEVVGEALVTGSLFVSNSSSFDSQMRPLSAIGQDVYFFVSGSISGSGVDDKKAVFGGDVRVSGTLAVGTGSIVITSDYIQFGHQGAKMEYVGDQIKFFDSGNSSGITLSELRDSGGGGGGGVGPQGPQGPQGAQGSSGTAGSSGSSGAQGPQGAAGPQGPQGATGSNGAQGAAGATGAQGVAGAQGPQGAVGSQGPQGDSITGPQGASIVGAQGAIGPQGSQGPQGAAGVGTQGPQGPQGATGTGTQGPQGAVGVGTQGPQGAQGPQGGQGAAGTGTQGPQGPQGTAGTSNTVLFFGANTLTNGLSTRYLIPGSGGTGSTVATQIGIPAPFSGSVTAIKAYHGTVDSTYAITYTVRINGVAAASPTTAVIGISANSSAGGGETIGSTTFVAGDVISVSCSYGIDTSRTVAATVTLVLQ